jgi:FemAB-related protein (PEP-CTERM system-associated)
MIRPLSPTASPPVTVRVHHAGSLPARLADLRAFSTADGPAPLSRDPGWLRVLRDGLHHDVYALEASADGRTCGFLPLAFVSSLLFGRFLVSLPYLDSNGVQADCPDVQTLLVSRAVELADELGVRHLELRHERPVEHPSINGTLSCKVHMRLRLPATSADLWDGFSPKVRNQVRKGERAGLTVTWGGDELLGEFYQVICHNMRDLGTPVYGRELFEMILTTFPERAELCVVRSGDCPIAAALVLHGNGVTEVPTASSLREYNHTCPNMLMYRHLLDRAVDRGQAVFDFGRSTRDGNTYRFKKQWGAEPHPAAWQYYLRTAALGEMRPDHPRYKRVIRLWQRLPLPVTRYLGPRIVRGIP